jgi:hypothetical protein
MVADRAAIIVHRSPLIGRTFGLDCRSRRKFSYNRFVGWVEQRATQQILGVGFHFVAPNLQLS